MIISAVIFDLNGTILSDEDEYGRAFSIVLKQFGVNSSEAPHKAGIGVSENWPKLIEKFNIKTDKSIEELTRETQSAYESLIKEVTLSEGVMEFIGDLKESGVKVALATSNHWPIVDKVFDQFGLEGIFDAVCTGEEVQFKKPAPDIFLLAAEKLQVEPGECLVFEDADAGITAAHEAGMKVIGVSRTGGEETLEEADEVISSFAEMTPEIIASI